ncbi:hypothetical protein Hanom_Chr06g00528441 [Helianthus anomalus]
MLERIRTETETRHKMKTIDDCTNKAAEGDDAVARGVEQRFEDVGYVSDSNVKGFTKPVVPKASTRCSARRLLRSAHQSTSSDPMDLSEDIEVSEAQGPDVDKDKNIVVHGKKKASCKKVTVTPVQGSSSKYVEGLSEDEVYVPNWSVKVGDSFKYPNVCANVLAHFASCGVWDAISEMEGDHFISRLMLSSCNLSSLVAEVLEEERKKSSMVVMKKEIDGFSKKEEAWVKKVGELTRRHEIDMNDLKKRFEADKLKLKLIEGLKASVAQDTGDNQWLIEQGFQQFYTKLLNYGKHLGLIVGFKLHESGQALEQSPMFRPDAFGVFKESVQQMERLTNPYVSEVSSCFGKPLSILQGLKPARLNETICAEVLDSLSKKRSHSGDSEETYSEDADVSKEASLEGSVVGGDVGPKSKKSKKAKKGKSDGSRASKPSAGV